MTRQLFEVIKSLYCLLVTTQLLIIFFWIGFWFILPSFRIPLTNFEPKGPYSVQDRLIWEGRRSLVLLMRKDTTLLSSIENVERGS